MLPDSPEWMQGLWDSWSQPEELQFWGLARKSYSGEFLSQAVSAVRERQKVNWRGLIVEQKNQRLHF